MRYKVEVGERSFEVDVTDGAEGTQVTVGGGEPRPAQLVPTPAPLYTLELGSRRRSVVVEGVPDEPGAWTVSLEGRPPVRVQPLDARFQHLPRAAGAAGRKLSKVKSPMPGVIAEVRVEAGQEVEKGQVLLILEAMKMQNEIRAEGAGAVKAVKVQAGAAVAAGALLIEFA